jgi:catechol-2,3-dioxygenase
VFFTAGALFSGAVTKKWEGGMSGIVFFNTQKLKQLKEFYINKIGCTMWMDQDDCVILRFGNMLIGFCQRDKADLDALITFFYEKKSDVDRYPIYNFFAKDPEGRNIEFQYFTGPIDWDFSR